MILFQAWSRPFLDLHRFVLLYDDGFHGVSLADALNSLDLIRQTSHFIEGPEGSDLFPKLMVETVPAKSQEWILRSPHDQIK